VQDDFVCVVAKESRYARRLKIVVKHVAKSLQRTAQRRLAHEEPRRRASHAALFGERGEDDEAIQVDPP
jgi:hypothetical protein